MVRGKSIYAELYIKNSYRAKCSPRVRRPMRPRAIAWAGPDAFYPNRFYEMDRWYKARIQRPELLPQLYTIDGNKIVKSYSEIMNKESSTSDKINIGFKINEIKKVEVIKNKKEMDEIIIDLGKLNFNQESIFNHNNIYQDLFQSNVFFNITQDMKINYHNNVSVLRGNNVSPSDMINHPNVILESFGNESFNTVLMVNLDGNAFTDNGQLLHWMVTNIPDGGSINNGDCIVDYLQPLPYNGSGYHRIAFITFRHKEKIKFDNVIRNPKTLEGRVFNMLKFFKINEDTLTPSSLAFSQVKHDESVDKKLKEMNEGIPIFKYKWREPLKREQKEFPEKPQPFDLYLDMYRPKEVVYDEMEKMRLEMSSSDKPLEKPKYPDINYVNNKKTMTSWEHARLLRKNTGSDFYGRLYDKE
uniref:Large ribosomal subunit protein mL38 n=1 Tax=Parastrongyloides trichosuri TaxID=131310 RepID=A0A0N4Z9S4_PARTI